MIHIREVWADGDENIYQYIISWIAKIVKTPWDKTMVAIVIQGVQGAGKTIICDFIYHYLLGKPLCCQTTGIDKLIQRFNGCIMSKLFINANEIASFEDSFHSAFDKIKTLITDSQVQIELKNIEPFMIDNFANVILTTNKILISSTSWN